MKDIFERYHDCVTSVYEFRDEIDKWVRLYVTDADRTVVLSGVGKSFINAQMGAAQLQAVSVNAVAIHATDLMHGGIGHMRQGGPVTFIGLSHSARTEELFAAIVQLRWTDSLLITGNSHGHVGSKFDTIFEYECEADGSRHGTIPAVSNIGQMLILNTIVCAVADGLDADELLANHPAGSLAKKYEEI